VHAVTETQITSLSDIIADLNRRRQQLATYIDTHLAELDADAYTRLVALEGQLASRIGRLMRDKKQVQGDEMDELDKMIDEALDQLSEEWGIEL
jgi:predicted AAA+ superfamily ATPase